MIQNSEKMFLSHLTILNNVLHQNEYHFHKNKRLLKKRISKVYLGYGKSLLLDIHLAKRARELFLNSIKYDKFSSKAYLLYSLTFFNYRFVALTKSLKKKLRDHFHKYYDILKRIS